MKQKKKGFFISSCIITLLILGAHWSFSNSHHAGSTLQLSKEPASSKERIALNLPLPAEEGLKLTMREHLEALDAIVAALGRKEYGKASKLAHEELGFQKHHVAMQREGGTAFPPAYHDLAMAHHSAAETLSALIPTGDFTQILPVLAQTMHACVECHQRFRL